MQDKECETGGRLSHWMEQIANFGPGMQSMLPDGPVQFFDDEFFRRKDEENDGRFYSSARIVNHIDKQASRNLEAFYVRHLKPGMRVLDLMCSVESHLPLDMDLEVTGLGLNLEELEQNPVLQEYMVHDLNQDPEIRCKPGSFDAVVCSLSIEYLTDPVAVLRSAYEMLAPGGVMLIGVSNRFFPTKAVMGWVDLHEFERMGFVRECLRRAGFDGKLGTASMRNDWRPTDDRHFLETRGVSDPVYVVWQYKAS
jgi:SAM-dependent methyltransferase